MASSDTIVAESRTNFSGNPRIVSRTRARATPAHVSSGGNAQTLHPPSRLDGEPTEGTRITTTTQTRLRRRAHRHRHLV
ncbi:hypothetical protein GCM10010411_51440 [Actinomadura fulvescens]|uniref:Uncharacterized protein n=1 Tax=Actinomadura fulvescens TaxID=46160 RepID=A0ABN3Q2C8_9ACTN